MMDTTAFNFSRKYQIMKIGKIKAKIGFSGISGIGFSRLEYQQSLKNKYPRTKNVQVRRGCFTKQPVTKFKP